MRQKKKAAEKPTLEPHLVPDPPKPNASSNPLAIARAKRAAAEKEKDAQNQMKRKDPPVNAEGGPSTLKRLRRSPTPEVTIPPIIKEELEVPPTSPGSQTESAEPEQQDATKHMQELVSETEMVEDSESDREAVADGYAGDIFVEADEQSGDSDDPLENSE